MKFKYQETVDLVKRQEDCEKIKENYPDRLPIICEKDPNSPITQISKTKYLVPYDMTVAQFSFIIRRKLNLEKDSALFLLVLGKHALTGSQTMNEVYEKYKDKSDGFLYIAYANELIWG